MKVNLKCPKCGQEPNSLLGFDSKRPDPDDIAICVECFSINIFKEDLSLREFTSEEWSKLTKEQRDFLIKAQEAGRVIKYLSPNNDN